LWGIASVQPYAEAYPEALDFTQLISRVERHPWEEADVFHYRASVLALLRWSTFCSVKSRLNTISNYLSQCIVDLQHGVAVDLIPVISYLGSLSRFPFHVDDRLRYYVFNPRAWADSALEIIPGLLRAIREFNVQTPYGIFFQYIRESSTLGVEPYRWRATRDVISLDAAPFSALNDTLAPALTDAAYHHSDELEAVNNGWFDTRVRELCSFWRPNEPVPIPYGILDYLANRDSDVALQELLFFTPISIHLWSCFSLTLSRGPSGRLFSVHYGPDSPDFALAVKALGVLASMTAHLSAPYESILQELQTATKSCPDTFSVIVMIKSLLVGSLLYSRAATPLRHPLLPTDTAIRAAPEFLDAEALAPLDTFQSFQEVLYNRIVEAKIALVAEFLHGFRSDFTPYKASDALRRICGDVPVPEAEIHATHQVRVAQGIHHLAQILDRDNSSSAELLDAIFDSEMFEVYFDAGQTPGFSTSNAHPWLQESSARIQIRDTLANYEHKFPSSHMVPRIRAIVDGLHYLHDGRVE
jgi:hypothetical protein